MSSCTVTTPEFVAFLAGVKKVSDDYMDRVFPTLEKPQFEASQGGRYIKIISFRSSQRCVHCFVDTTNGDVLKSASWKAPAKGARGNIFDAANGLGRMGPYGAEYNK